MLVKIAIAGFLNAIGLLLLVKAINLTNPAILGFVSRSYFLYSFLIGIFFFKDLVNKQQLLLLFIILIGIFLVSYQNLDGNNAIGIVYSIFFPLLFAGQNCIVKTIVNDENSNVLIVLQKTIALAIFIIWYFCSDVTLVDHDFYIAHNVLPYFFAIFSASIMTAVLGLRFLYKAYSLASFTIINSTKTLEPIFVLMICSLWLPPNLNLFNYLGISMATIGLLFFFIMNSKNRVSAK